MLMLARQGIMARRAAEAFTANAVHFDGTNDRLGPDGITGQSDSDKVLLSFFGRFASNSNAGMRLIVNPSAFTVVRNSNALLFTGSVGAVDLLVAETTTNIFDNMFHHVLFTRENGTVLCHIDDVTENLDVTANDNGAFGFSDATWVFSGFGGGSPLIDGDMAVTQLWTGTSLDTTQQVNRRLFIDAEGEPVDPKVASDALGAPDILFDGATDQWHVNKGTGGGFTENGALTDGHTPVVVGT